MPDEAELVVAPDRRPRVLRAGRRQRGGGEGDGVGASGLRTRRARDCGSAVSLHQSKKPNVSHGRGIAGRRVPA